LRALLRAGVRAHIATPPVIRSNESNTALIKRIGYRAIGTEKLGTSCRLRTVLPGRVTRYEIPQENYLLCWRIAGANAVAGYVVGFGPVVRHHARKLPRFGREIGA